MPQLKVTRLEGTYLVWVDHSALGISTDEFFNRLLDEGHVWVSAGTMYGPQTGEGFIRINIACPRSQLNEALRRIASVVNS
jgi:cystathionine beta-lyase